MNHYMKKAAALLSLSLAISGGGAAYAAAAVEQDPSVPVAVPILAPVEDIGLQVVVNEVSVDGHGFYEENSEELMLPLRAITEALGFTLEWNPEDYSVELSRDGLAAYVKTGESKYVLNEEATTLEAAAELVDSKLYVPASYFTQVLEGKVSTEGSIVLVTQPAFREYVLAKGTVTAVTYGEKSGSIQIKGFGMDGIVLHANEETVIQAKDGSLLDFADLALGTEVEVEHSIIAALSLPPQIAAYKITVLSQLEEKDIIGTSGTIEDVRVTDEGEVSLLIKGQGLTETSPEEVVLRLTEDTIFLNADGEAIEAEELEAGARVVGFYGPGLTKSLPPIGTALKIVKVADAPEDADEALPADEAQPVEEAQSADE